VREVRKKKVALLFAREKDLSSSYHLPLLLTQRRSDTLPCADGSVYLYDKHRLEDHPLAHGSFRGWSTDWGVERRVERDPVRLNIQMLNPALNDVAMIWIVKPLWSLWEDIWILVWASTVKVTPLYSLSMWFAPFNHVWTYKLSRLWAPEIASRSHREKISARCGQRRGHDPDH